MCASLGDEPSPLRKKIDGERTCKREKCREKKVSALALVTKRPMATREREGGCRQSEEESREAGAKGGVFNIGSGGSGEKSSVPGSKYRNYLGHTKNGLRN